MGTWTVETRGVGRKDYSAATEKTVEPLISSWQSVYIYRNSVVVPAGGSVITDVNLALKQVALLYDFFASIPANRLIRLEVYAVDEVGTTVCIVDETDYQTIQSHLLKGFPVFITVRFITHNYGDVDEEIFFGCTGLYTTLDEYFIATGSLPPLF